MTWRHRHQEEESELRTDFRDATHSDTCAKEGSSHYMPAERARKWKSQSSPLYPLCNCWWELTDSRESFSMLWKWSRAILPKGLQWEMMILPYTGFPSIPILHSLLFRDINYTNIWWSCCGHHENNCKVVNTSIQILTSWSRMVFKYSNSLVDFSAVYWYS